MKKFVLIMMAALGLAFAASARDIYAHDASVLPEAARTTISNNFKAKVSVVKIEKTLGRVDDYEVVLADGSEITFDRNGNWDNVEVANSASVPKGFVPAAVSDYVKKSHVGTRIVGIDKDRTGYDVELSNGIDIKFDKGGNFIRYDD